MTFEDNCAVLDRLFAAIPAGDIAAVEQIYAPGAEIWHNNDNVTQGVADNLRTLAWVSRNVKGVRYEEVRRTSMDSGQIVQEHVLRGAAPNGTPLEVVACIVFTFDDDGHIVRLEEYLDTAQTAVLAG